VQLRISVDGRGATWTDPLEIVPTMTDDPHRNTCGYTDLVATGSDRFLLVYSHFRHKDDGGQMRKAIKVCEVRVHPAT
jgi:hypothetical protein